MTSEPCWLGFHADAITRSHATYYVVALLRVNVYDKEIRSVPVFVLVTGIGLEIMLLCQCFCITERY